MSTRFLHLAACTVDLAARVVRFPGEERQLSPLELKLLVHLTGQAGRSVSKEELLREVWGYRSTRTRTLATTIHRLREKIEADPNAPVHVLTVHREGYRFAPLAPPSSAPTPSLARVPLFGRESERVHLTRTLDQSSVTTVVGPAGSGKTRLVAEAVQGRDRTVWVDLLGAVDRTEVLRRISAAVGLPIHDEAALASLPALDGARVVFDDADGALDAVSGLIGRGSPRTRWVITSREPMAIAGEQIVRIDGLSESGTALFAALAEEPPSAAMRAIVARLDGLPLAIELAAAWAPWCPLPVLAERPGFDWLAGGRRDAPARHASLGQAIAASWALLDDDERRVMRAAATFVDPAPFDAVVEVAGARSPDVVRRLAVRSLLRVAAGLVRPYTVVSAWVVQQLDGTAFEAAHGRWAARLAEPARLERFEQGDLQATAELSAAANELAVAVHRAAIRGDAAIAQACAHALATHETWAGRDLGRAVAAVETALAAAPDARGPLLVRLARLRYAQGRSNEAATAVAEGLAADPDPATRADLWRVHGQLAMAAGRTADAEQAFRSAIDLATTAGDPFRAALSLGHLGFLFGNQRRTADAERLTRESLGTLRALGYRRYEAKLLPNLAQLVADAGQDGIPLITRAVALQRELGDRKAEAISRLVLGGLWADRRDFSAAHAEFAAARDAFVSLGLGWFAARADINDAAALMDRGGHDAAALEQLQSALPVVESAGDRGFVAVGRCCLGLLAVGRGELAVASLELESALAACGDADPDSLQLILTGLAVLDRQLGRPIARPLPVGPDPGLGIVATLLEGGAGPNDPRWLPVVDGTGHAARLGRAITQAAPSL